MKTTNEDYSLGDCGEAIRLGKMAVDDFTMAQDMYETWNEQQKKKKNFDYAEFDFNESYSNSGSCPGLAAEIEINIKIGQLILNSVEMKEEKNRNEFLSMILRQDTGINKFFKGIETFPWESYILFLSKLCIRSFHCLEALTRKLSYASSLTNEGVALEKIIGRLICSFNKCFMQCVEEPWHKKLSSLKDPTAKAGYLSKLFESNLMTCFGWMCRESDKEELGRYQLKLIRLEELVKDDTNTITFSTKDKIAYVTVFFALKYQQYNIEYPITLNLETVKVFLKQLISMEDLEYPEPFLFYLMLSWQKNMEAVQNEEEILFCIKRLKELERKNINRHLKLKFLFIFNENEGWNLIPINKKPTKKQLETANLFEGKLDGDKNVELTLQSGNVLRIRVADLSFSITNLTEEVSFVVVFTLGGPLAYDWKRLRWQKEEEAMKISIGKAYSDSIMKINKA